MSPPQRQRRRSRKTRMTRPMLISTSRSPCCGSSRRPREDSSGMAFSGCNRRILRRNQARCGHWWAPARKPRRRTLPHHLFSLHGSPVRLLPLAQHATPRFRYSQLAADCLQEPKVGDEGITGTDLKPRFYEHLETFSGTQQILAVDNTEPPPAFIPKTTHFTKNPAIPRSGLFPYIKKS
jgi:hypothetical protein